MCEKRAYGVLDRPVRSKEGEKTRPRCLRCGKNGYLCSGTLCEARTRFAEVGKFSSVLFLFILQLVSD